VDKTQFEQALDTYWNTVYELENLPYAEADELDDELLALREELRRRRGLEDDDDINVERIVIPNADSMDGGSVWRTIIVD